MPVIAAVRIRPDVSRGCCGAVVRRALCDLP